MESHRWIIPCWQLWCAVVAVYIYLDPFASVCLLQQSRNGTNQSQHGTQPHSHSVCLSQTQRQHRNVDRWCARWDGGTEHKASLRRTSSICKWQWDLRSSDESWVWPRFQAALTSEISRPANRISGKHVLHPTHGHHLDYPDYESWAVWNDSELCTKHEACWDEATQKRFLLQCNYRTGFQGSRCKNAEYYLKSLWPGSQIETSTFASALNMWRSVESAALFHF